MVNQQVRASDRSRPRSDDGFILPLALILTVVLGAVIVSIASYTTTTLRSGTVVRTRVERLAASDAGVKITLEKLRTGSAQCPRSLTAPASTIFGPSINGADATINGQDVVVTCQRTILAAEELGEYALVVTSHGVPTDLAFAPEGNQARSRRVGGNIFLAYRWDNLVNTHNYAPVELSGGDLYYSDSDCSTTVTPPPMNWLTFVDAPDRGYECTTDVWDTRAPTLSFTAPPAVNQSAIGIKDAATGCITFSPGTYTSPPVIGSGTENFFLPGTYYFKFSAANTNFQIKGAVVMGGVPGKIVPPSTRPPGIAAAAPSLTAAFPPVKCASAVNTVQNNTSADSGGVTWVFADNSRLTLESQAKLELFASGTSASATTPKPLNRWSIVALENNQTINGATYATSTLVPSGSAETNMLLNLKPGSNNGVVVHGGVWAPRSYVSLGNVAQAANGQFMGGLIVGRLGIQAAASAGNLNLSVPTRPVTRRYILRSTSGPVTTSVTAIVRTRISPSKPGSILVQSWRVE